MKKLVIITLLLMYSLTSIGQIKSTRNTTETDRNFVVLEIGTGTWCSLCQGAAMGVEDMIQEGLDVAVIEYHYDDDYANTASNSRLIDYYDVPGYPSSFFDGVLPFYGGYNDISLYFQYLPLYEERINIPSPFELVTNIQPTGDDNFNVSVTVTDLDNYQSTNLKLHIVLTESNILEDWQGQTELDYVCRDMIPNQYGTSLDFSSQNTQFVDLEVNVPYELANCEIITFVQDNDTKEILQATKTNLSTVGIIEMSSFDMLKLYPNPTSGKFTIESEDINSVEIIDMTGKCLKSYQYPGINILNIDISDFPKGAYFMHLQNENQSIVRKVLVN